MECYLELLKNFSDPILKTFGIYYGTKFMLASMVSAYLWVEDISVFATRNLYLFVPLKISPL